MVKETTRKHFPISKNFFFYLKSILQNKKKQLTAILSGWILYHMKGDEDLQNKERINIKYIINFNYDTEKQKTNTKLTSGARILQ